MANDGLDDLGIPEDEYEYKHWFEGLSARDVGLLEQALEGMPPVSPNKGPQMQAYRSPAKFTGFGGAAGGGKSALLALLVLFGHTKSVIFRHDAAELSNLINLIREWYGTSIGLNNQAGIFRFADRENHFMEWGGLGKPGAEFRWQGREHDLVGFDEMQFLPKEKVRYVGTWCRTTIEGQRTRKVGTFNPPGGVDGLDITGMWILDFFGPWINESHPWPAGDGEVRYFLPMDTVDNPDDREQEYMTGEPIEMELHGRKVPVMPEARTFIHSSVMDNPYWWVEGNDYISDLFSLPEPYRSQMLYGDFRSGIKDQAYQMIPGAWVDAAMDRWESSGRQKRMSSLGVDIGQGPEGRSFSVFVRRHGWWWDEIFKVPGKETKLGSDAAMLAIRENHEGATICCDANGTASAAYEAILNRTKPYGVKVIPIKGQEVKSAICMKFHRIASGFKLGNLRTALYWCLRKVLDPDNGLDAQLPKNPRLRKQLITPTYEMRGATLWMESKSKVEERLRYSPDEADGVAYSLANVFETLGFEKLLPGNRRQRPVEYSEKEQSVLADEFLRRHGSLGGFPVRDSSNWMAT